LQTFGFTGDFAHPGFSDAFKAGTELVCKHKVYQGKTIEKWDFPHGAGEKQAASADLIRQMSARWKTQHSAQQRPL
jgi:hypothetical protein